jgi:hypothetical protein
MYSYSLSTAEVKYSRMRCDDDIEWWTDEGAGTVMKQGNPARDLEFESRELSLHPNAWFHYHHHNQKDALLLWSFCYPAVRVPFAVVYKRDFDHRVMAISVAETVTSIQNISAGSLTIKTSAPTPYPQPDKSSLYPLVLFIWDVLSY